MKRPHRAERTDDGALVERVRRGDQSAFGELVHRHQRALYRHARGMGIDHDGSLDLVQDAFVRAYGRLDDCRNPEHFRAWMYRIVRNLCLDHLKNRRNAHVSLDEAGLANSLASAEDAVVNAVLRVALASLPVPMREAFLLKHDAGYTYEQVAELTGASPSAVKMRVHRAREALRAFLLNRGVFAA